MAGNVQRFDLSAISVPVLVMHGQRDQFVPFGHGQWLAAHVPGPLPGCTQKTVT